jgi:hypothetical protein
MIKNGLFEFSTAALLPLRDGGKKIIPAGEPEGISLTLKTTNMNHVDTYYNITYVVWL